MLSHKIWTSSHRGRETLVYVCMHVCTQNMLTGKCPQCLYTGVCTYIIIHTDAYSCMHIAHGCIHLFTITHAYKHDLIDAHTYSQFLIIYTHKYIDTYKYIFTHVLSCMHADAHMIVYKATGVSMYVCAHMPVPSMLTSPCMHTDTCLYF